MQSSSARDEQHGLEEFEQFYSREFTQVARFLLHLGASHQDAQDAAQDAFFYCLQNWPHITDRRAWIRVVARRALYSKISKAARSVVRESLPDDSSLVVYDEIPQLEKERVLGLLSFLPQTQRVVMAMYYDGDSVAEIAEALGSAPSTVRVHLHRARQQLKGLLASSWSGNSAEESQ
jgi:RNA polymerase sigma-70 factor (ECF subfamily)